MRLNNDLGEYKAKPQARRAKHTEIKVSPTFLYCLFLLFKIDVGGFSKITVVSKITVAKFDLISYNDYCNEGLGK